MNDNVKVFVLALSLATSGAVTLSTGALAASRPVTQDYHALTAREATRYRAISPGDFAIVRQLAHASPRRADRSGHWTGWYRRELAKLRRGGTWAVAEMLVSRRDEMSSLTRQQRDDLRTAMTSFLAAKKDVALIPVLRALLVSPGASPGQRDAAASGLARLADRGGQKILLANLESKRQPLQIAALHGLRNVRTTVALDEVVALLERKSLSDTLTIEGLRTIGYQGSSWAWGTDTMRARRSEEQSFRYRCARVALRFALHGSERVQRRARLTVAMVVKPRDMAKLDDMARGLISGNESQIRWRRLRATLQRWWARSEEPHR